MTAADEARKANAHIISIADTYFAQLKASNDFAVLVQKRKEEAQANQTFLDNAPEDVVEESAGRMVNLLKSDEQQMMRFVPTLPYYAIEGMSFMNSGSITTTSVQAEAYIAYTYQRNQGEDVNWYKPVQESFEKLADDRAKNDKLPSKLDKIGIDLGVKFKEAINSVYTARTENIGADVAIFHMRDIIQDFWGGITNLSRAKDPVKFKREGREDKYKRLSLAKETNRKIVAECWTTNADDQKDLKDKLEVMYNLSSEMSDTQEAKNILNRDVEKMNAFYNRWILSLDNLVGEFDI